jgi:hypothetical protein
VQQFSNRAHGFEADQQLATSVLPEMLFHLIPEIVLSDELHEPSQMMNGHLGKPFNVQRFQRGLFRFLHFVRHLTHANLLYC